MQRTTLFIALLAAANFASAAPWTYRGTLYDGGKPANGTYDVRLTLINAAGNASISQPITVFNVPVKDGSFSAEVDFGTDLANAPAMKLKTEVNQAGSGFVSLGEPSNFDPKAALAGECWGINGNGATDIFGGIVGNNGTAATVGLPEILGVRNGSSLLYLRNGGGIEQNASFAAGTDSFAVNTSSAGGANSFTAGRGITAAGHSFSTVFADGTAGVFESNAPNQFKVRADGGFLVNQAGSPSIDDDFIFRAKPISGSAELNMKLASRTGKSVLMAVFDNNGDFLIAPLTAGGKTEIRSFLGISRVAAANQLEVEGNASKTTAGSWLANSDRRIKIDIAPLRGALALINQVEPVTFRYANPYRAQHDSISAQRYYNVIAQDFAKVFPDSVKSSGEYLPGKAKTSENEILQVDTYPALITTIAAVQELDAQNTIEQTQLAQLRAENAALKARLDAIEAKLAD
jgi:Chaperone of endosialidase